jgi:hypothetical protein
MSVLAYTPGLPEGARKHCAMREKQFPYFREGWVSLDLGRHTNYTDAIRAATVPDESGKAYAVADAQGNIIQRYSTFANAVEKRARARAIQARPELEPEDEAPVVNQKPASGAVARA